MSFSMAGEAIFIPEEWYLTVSTSYTLRIESSWSRGRCRADHCFLPNERNRTIWPCELELSSTQFPLAHAGANPSGNVCVEQIVDGVTRCQGVDALVEPSRVLSLVGRGVFGAVSRPSHILGPRVAIDILWRYGPRLGAAEVKRFRSWGRR